MEEANGCDAILPRKEMMKEKINGKGKGFT